MSWKTYINTADEFLIEYSLWCPLPSFAVKLFLVGHAVELYLKGSLIKLGVAVGFSHDLRQLLSDCKAHDPNFLPQYELREPVLALNDLLAPHSVIEPSLSPEDYMHFVKNQEFYYAAKALADLKYFPGPMKNSPSKAKAIAFESCNQYWAVFFRESRRYLGLSGGPIRLVLEYGGLDHPASRFFLETIDPLPLRPNANDDQTDEARRKSTP